MWLTWSYAAAKCNDKKRSRFLQQPAPPVWFCPLLFSDTFAPLLHGSEMGLHGCHSDQGQEGKLGSEASVASESR